MSRRTWWARWRTVPEGLIATFWQSEPAVMLTSALAAGISAGLGAVAVLKLIGLLAQLVASGDTSVQPRWLLVVLLPAAGGLIAGLCARLGPPAATRLDLTDVIAAMAAG